jgi:hypothetical protein
MVNRCSGRTRRRTKKNQLDIKGIAGIGFAIRSPSIICVSFAVYSQSDGGDRGGAHSVGFPNIAGMAAEAGRWLPPAQNENRRRGREERQEYDGKMSRLHTPESWPGRAVVGGLWKGSGVAHDLGAAIAVVEVVAEAHHAARTEVIKTDALRTLAARGVRDGLDALGAPRAAQDLDTRRRRVDADGDRIRGRGFLGGGRRLGRSALRVAKGGLRLRSRGVGSVWASHGDERGLRCREEFVGGGR